MAPTTSSNVTDFDVITLGESMWRLSPPGFQRLETTQRLDINVAGAESNVAAALARLGKRVAWWSRLPDNPPGHHVANTLRMLGVDVSGVAWGGARLGTYYVEFGSHPRPAQITYDRENSSASQMSPDDFDWSKLRARWLHVTGITPALSESCRATVQRAIQEARAGGVKIAFDVNYRGKLWTWDEARLVYDELASMADVVITAERDAVSLLGEKQPTEHLARALHERWNGATVVVTAGTNGATAFDGRALAHADAFDVNIVDRVGAGDAFDAGLLCGLLEEQPLESALRFGCAVAALKLTMPGDMAIVTRAEVNTLLESSAVAGGIVR